jgi:hypothetical protein
LEQFQTVPNCSWNRTEQFKTVPGTKKTLHASI